MSAYKIVPGGERVGKAPFSGPALRASRDRPGSVIRRSGRRPAEHYPTWGDPIGRRIDWPLILFCVGWAIGFGVLLNLAFVRGGW